MRGFPIFKKLILLLNLGAALLLTMAQLATLVPPSVCVLFSITALIYPVLVVINLVFIVFWGVSRSKYWLISLLIIVFGLHNLLHNFRLQFKQDDTRNEKDIKAITYNVRLFSTDETGKDSVELKNQIIDFLQSEQADIICLQEYHSMDRNVYLPLVELSTTLGQKTYYYESYYNPRYDQLSGLVIFSRYKAVGKGKLKFSGSRTFGIYTDLLIDTDTVRVLNIHLASIRLQESDIDFVLSPDFNDKEKLRSFWITIFKKLKKAFLLREQQMQYVIREIDKSPYPVLLAGDFNDTPSSYIYNQLNKYLTDSFTLKGNKLSRTYAGNIPYLRIDYVFTSDNFNIKRYKRVQQYYSDHFPVIVVMNKK